ncbi:MAG: hypothetical protein IPH60_18595 [Flavobacteriales bacterium]|nr:hypothetical protein [Flavobacteriales bacterium]MBK7483507.1 hypothetical protein [Flavobacteriales bacterium]MBK7620882.1 hypothetical protein [Flavobacteriales bacterium]
MKNLSLTVLLVLVSGVSNAQLLDAVALDSVRTYRKLDRALRSRTRYTAWICQARS